MSKDKDYFIENLAMLIDSGMDLLSALDTMKSEIKSPGLLKTIEKVKEEIDTGSPLWQAMEKTHLLSGASISLIRIGEESGNLAENLNIITIQQQKDRDFRSKIRSAMMYPLMVLSLTLVIGIGISWFILPKLAVVFSDLKIKLPFITKILINTGIFLSIHGSIVIPLFLAAIFLLIYVLFFFSKTKFIGQAMLFKVPGIKKIMLEVELSRFGYILGTLLDAGLPVIDAINSMINATEMRMYKKLYLYLRDQIEEGNSFHKSFNTYKNSRKLIPRFIQQIITAGESSGKLSEALLKIGRTYESKTELTAKNLTVLLEPFLLIIVWLGVLGVALAVILPIYSLIGGFNAT